jgi:putative heme-binding domain-containing protein
LFFVLDLSPGLAQEKQGSAIFFLPKNPAAAAYVLSRLSNGELIEAPRSEFVDVALLQRKGIDKKYRLEALDGLVGIRHTDGLTELLRAIAELDNKGVDSSEPLRDLFSILLHANRADISAHREQLDQLLKQSKLPVTRQGSFAGVISADGAVEPSWSNAQSDSAQLVDLVLGLPLIADSSLRAQFYGRVKSLLPAQNPSELRQAAIKTIVSLPGHDSETFAALAALVDGGAQTAAVIESLAQIPRAAWPKETVSLVQSIVEHLQKVPPEERAETSFTTALEFGTELERFMPPDAARDVTRTLRKLGPTVITLHAVFEQMRFDQELIVVETGKPAVIILQNDDAMPHNLAILAPGALKEVGLAAEKMPPEPDSEGRLYVPTSPKVLQATKLVNPGQKIQLAFNAPEQVGDYPFACTFPGHWLRMAGTMTVVPDLDAYFAAHPRTEQPKLIEWKLADFSSDLPQAEVGRNVPAGKELFSKLACIQCHKLGDDGYNYGPELTYVFKRYNNDRASILQQILEPSKIIDERYRNFNLELNNGDSVVGMILKDDGEKLTIQSGPADSLIQLLKKSEIRRRRPLASSPMPVGLLNALSKGQIFDLLAYLQSGGSVSSHEHTH